MSMDQITDKARVFADARARLAEAVDALNASIEALRREQLPAIKRHLRRTFEAEQALRGLVELHPALFVKPRTLVLHGIKVGLQKGKGVVRFKSAARVVQLIEQRMPDMADVLIDTVKTPSKTALSKLTVQQLRSIGCEVDDSGDQVVVRATDTAIDKLVNALIRGMEIEADQAET